LTTPNQRCAGRPERPLGPDWKPSASATRLLGMPMVVKFRIARRSWNRM
jgi:hypothetical protein